MEKHFILPIKINVKTATSRALFFVVADNVMTMFVNFIPFLGKAVTLKFKILYLDQCKTEWIGAHTHTHAHPHTLVYSFFNL